MLSVFADLKANAELADSLYSELGGCYELQMECDSILESYENLDKTRRILIEQAHQENRHLEKLLKRKGFFNKVLLGGLFVAIILIPVF